MKLFTKIFLCLIGLAFLKVGIETFMNPQAVVANVDMVLNTNSALSTIRAVYAGMHFVFGAYCVYGAFKAPANALGLLILYAGGYVIGRLSGILIDGMPNQFVLTWLGTEVFTLAVSLYLRWQLTRKPVAAGTYATNAHA
ncbi:uncharacterized protein DUF4345 [Chitinophaga skermanii]|uniref:Uncharacterized protein DUF4345 n=1 Tax=Chitinophaga skermanii TaxID=331697 RepID=A0A327QN52_9BACT|nr:DUF4345 domain-containing protein [Chitinophaga skermanii]RAJ05124.1 uncharacterized protein DUF4345 [Chitinophaga skermanii]